MKKVLLTLLAMVFLSVGAFAAGITVSGTAERMVQPDLAYIELGVETRGDTAQSAVAQNAEIMSRVMQQLQAACIAKEDLATSAFSLSPQYRYPKDEAPVLTGYLASNLLRITLRGEDLGRIGEVIDITTEAGVNKVQNIIFTVEKSQELELELLAEAVKNGKKKAQIMAQAADVKLGKLLDLSNSYASVLPLRMNVREDFAVMKAAASTPIQPGEIKISAQVNLQYDLGN